MKVSTILQRARKIAGAGLGFGALSKIETVCGPAYSLLSNALGEMESHGELRWQELEGVRATFDIAISMALSDEAAGT